MEKVEILKKLISVDTTSYKSNLELIRFIENYLKQYNIVCSLTYDETNEKANILATIPDSNGNKIGGLLLSGHTDVVPVTNQKWDTDPFTPTIINDKIYGRGSSDMKGFIAVVLSLVPELTTQKLKKPIHFSFSYDEEIGCTGIVKIVNDIRQKDLKPEACVVGEPSSMQVISGHKGVNIFNCQITGREAHSSLTPRGTNAIEYAAMIICKIRELANSLKVIRNEDYDVPFSTLSTNMIGGGIAQNIIPSMCEFVFELRNLPENKADLILTPLFDYINNEILSIMQKEYPDAAIQITNLSATPGLHKNSSTPFQEMLYSLCRDHAIHKVAYATEAGIINNSGIDTIVCGPGSIEQAHKPNEFIEIAQLDLCEQFLRKLIVTF